MDWTREFVLACALGASYVPGATAQDIHISGPTCSQRLHIVADHIAAAELLEKLAVQMGFQLTLQEPLDSVDHLDSTLTVYELLTGPLGADVIITQRPDKRCPGKLRIARVWVLRKGASVAAPSAPKPGVPLAAAPRPAVPVLTTPITPEAQEQDELYQRAHGMMPEVPASATAK